MLTTRMAGLALCVLSLNAFGARPTKALSEEKMDLLSDDLVEAISNSSLKQVSTLLSNGADPNRIGRQGMSPLEFVVRSRDTVLLAKLLDAGGNPDLIVSVRDVPGKKIPLLFLAACHDQSTVARILLDRGADAKSQVHGVTVFSMAARCDQPGQYRFFSQRLEPPSPEARKHHASVAAAHKSWSILEIFRQDSISLDPDSMAAGLTKATYDNDMASVRKYLDLGSPADHKRRHSDSPLLIATVKKQERLVRTLLEHGAEVSFPGERGSTALMVASKDHDTAILSLLLTHDRSVGAVDDYGQNAWYYASLEAFPLLSRHKVPWDVNDREGRSPLSYACANHKWEKAQALLELRRNRIDSSLDAQNSLLQCLQGGNLALAQRILDAKAPLNLVPPGGPTLLQQTLRTTWDSKRADPTTWLLSHGADPNLANAHGQTPFQTALDASQWLPLANLISYGAKGDLAAVSYQVVVASAESGNDTLLKSVLEQGCDINGIDNPFERTRKTYGVNFRRSVGTPLVHFVREYKPEIARKLLALGANPNVKDTSGVPALLTAIGFYQIETVQALLESGADVDAKDAQGRGWPEYLKKFPYDEMKAILKAREVKP